MFKYCSVILLLISVSCGSLINVPQRPETLSNFEKSDLWTKWEPHIMDFLELIDVEKVLLVLLENINDPEVLNFIGFIFSDQFKEVVWEFESMTEFKEVSHLLQKKIDKVCIQFFFFSRQLLFNDHVFSLQATTFLISKGYDVTSILNIINTALDLPPFEKPKSVSRNSKGLTGLIEAIVATLPLEDMRKLFESKLETVPEIAGLFETINSEQFMEIMKRMSQNPKYAEFKTLFESYGFDFKNLCLMSKEIFGKYYQGIFCD